MTWDQPTAETCPKCGKSLFKRRGGLIVCLNEDCGYERKAERKKKGAAESEEKAGSRIVKFRKESNPWRIRQQ